MNIEDPGMKDMLEFVELGNEAEAFLASPVGQYIQERCSVERADAVSQLIQVDPTDSRAVLALQNKAWRAEELMIWLIQAVQNGTDAAIELRGGYAPH